MVVMPIEWHEECAGNQRVSLQRLHDEMQRSIQRYEDSLKSFEFYAKQISEAKRRGKQSFDSERFLVKSR